MMTDVFLAHNSKDKSAVRKIAKQLTDRSISVWLDEDQIPPGGLVNDLISDGLRKCNKFAVFLGPHGAGLYQGIEIGGLLKRALDNNLPVIPVHLPGYADESSLVQLYSYKPVVYSTSIEDDNDALESLTWAITGKKPSVFQKQTSPKRPQQDDDIIQDALNDISELITTPGLTIFVGPRSCCGSRNPLPSQSELAKELLRSLNVIDDRYEELLPLLNEIGLYYATSKGTYELEHALHQKLVSNVNKLPASHLELAQILKKLSKLQPRRRSRATNLQLVFTTNLDMLIEIALLSKGVPFSRLVQDRTKTRLYLTEFTSIEQIDENTIQVHSPDSPVRAVSTKDYAALQKLVAESRYRYLSPDRSTEELQQPLLYKYHGSLDIQGSCAISADQYFSLTSMQGVIPDGIIESVSNSASLFVGYGLLDPELQQSYQSFIKDAFEQRGDLERQRYIIQETPDPKADVYQRIEASVWKQLRAHDSARMNLSLLVVAPEVFLKRLREMI